jgi:hypothetical protein
MQIDEFCEFYGFFLKELPPIFKRGSLSLVGQDGRGVESILDKQLKSLVRTT